MHLSLSGRLLLRLLTRRFLPGSILLFTVVLTASRSHAQAPISTTLVTTNATGRWFKGRSEPTPADLPAWRAVAFSDASWTTATAPFWYGESALFAGRGTQLSDMANSYSTVYLRFRFTVANPAAYETLQLNVMCDDGFTAWINGRQVASLNAPAGQPTFNSFASANIPEPITLTPYNLADPATLLVPGENVLAVQVFNTTLGSSDLVYAGELIATGRASGAPTIARVTPTPGPVNSLDAITVTFSEPVRGVRAEDFLVNGASASQVTGSGTTYTYTFPRPAFGEVSVSWISSHTIEDFESPPRRFESAGPDAFWRYELIDPEGPSLAMQLPPAGSTVAALTQISVTFNKAVAGIDAADLTLNGVPATQVSGLGAGPYLFEFPATAAAAGSARVSWQTNHGITSDAFEPHPFFGSSWNYTVTPTARPPALAITEIMAENFTAYRDEDQDPEDWIEIWNPTASAVNLAGWSLSNDPDEPDRWIFPATSLPAGGYLTVFASGKDRRPGTSGRLHTGFKLNPNGGSIALYSPELPRRAVAEIQFPEQGPDYSWGRQNNTGDWRYFKSGTPGNRNGSSTITRAVDSVRFSVPRGYFTLPFNLSLTCDTPGATIRYTTNGSPPSESNGFVYTAPLRLDTTRVLRAAAFASNALPSRIATHTYLFNQTGTRLRLPALSLVTDTNNLYGRNGIMEVSPRNTTKRGAAWERPVSAELIRVEDNGGFQTDCGLRLQGGDYVRGQYNYRTTSLPFSKYSFRLYFRGEYGQGRLDYPLFPETTQQSFDTVVLRAGMNDHSNPYLLDEMVRSLARDCGQPSSVGTFVHLFLNGVYKGYYNPCERIDVDFLRAYHGGGPLWDVLAQSGEVREGDATFFNNLRNLAATANLSDPAKYNDLANRLDLVNFIDYLCPLIYVDNDDWPHNNWRAARERVAGGRYRFYVWDAEWSFGVVNGHSPSFNTILNQLSSLSPPWGGTDIQRIFTGLKKAPEFRLLFADRVHKHFFNGGALTDERIRARYADVTNRLNGVVSGFNNSIATSWIPNRRRNVLTHFDRAGLLASSNAPAFAQHGGRVPSGFRLVITNLTGTIYYTVTGADPRLPFSGEIHPDARTYTPPLILASPTVLRARSLTGTNWSALTEATFQIDQLQPNLRITEIMYNPPDGDAFEFLEIANLGGTPFDLSGASFSGITFRFPEPTPPLPPGAHWVLASSTRPADFKARYPEVNVAGWFDGSLANGGERIELRDRDDQRLCTVQYGDQSPWPTRPDGGGASLQLVAPEADPNVPESWTESPDPLGSPGRPNPIPGLHALRFAEVYPGSSAASDTGWLELANLGLATIDLFGWSLTDDSNPRKFVFPRGTTLAPNQHLRVWADDATSPPGWHSGFRLSESGETIALFDPSTNRIDAVTFGPTLPGFSFARLGIQTEWRLAEPTPASANEPAALASSSALSINEWLANPNPGEPDWIELHNNHPTLPASLAGLYLGTSNALHRWLTPLFIPPSGFRLLPADGDLAPDHLPFKLPATGDAIILYDRDGSELQRVTYRNQPAAVSSGRVPDGTGSPILLTGTPSPGASNHLGFAEGPRINEFMAHNTSSLRDNEGRAVDWIEIANPGNRTLDLAGFRLAVGTSDLEFWTFPTGTRLTANGLMVIRCDASRPADLLASTQPNSGLALRKEGGEVWLLNPAGQATDHIRYGAQLPDRSVGLAGSSFTLLANPTPATRNSNAAPLGNPGAARLNEWLASANDSGDWFELFNPESSPIDLAGFRLTDDPSRAGLTNHVIAPLTFLSPRGFAVFHADEQTQQGPDHVPFRLNYRGDLLRLYDPLGAVVDSVDLLLLPLGISEGRLPDGANTLQRFEGSSSPGTPNWIPHPDVVIHEVLAHTDPPIEDAIEVHNPSGRSVDLSGWYLSNDAAVPEKIRIAGTTLTSGAFHVFYEQEFNNPAQPGAFTLNSAHGDDVWLSETDASGTLTGRRAHAHIPASANAESYGRFRVGFAWDFAPMSRLTFGKDLPRSLEEFRQGQGLPNAYPRVGPVVITEIHALPTAEPTGEEQPDGEFLEIRNLTSTTVPLHHPLIPTSTWRLRGGVQFEFPPSTTLAANTRALVVAFSPTNTATLQSFRQTFAVPANTPIFGPFRGRLENNGEEIRLERPDTPQAPPHPDAGFVPWLEVDRVAYRASLPWPDVLAHPGESLQRKRDAEYGNDPANWVLALPSAGAPTRAPLDDRDLDGLPNDWETAQRFDPDNPADAALDTDGDGQSNLAEFFAGTDPRSAADALRLRLEWLAANAPGLKFRAVAGRSYSILVADEAQPGTWTRWLDVPSSTADRETEVSLSLESTTTRFFRIVTPALP